MSKPDLLSMLERLWHVAEFDGEEREYEDIQLALIEAGRLEPPPPEPVRWGPVHGPLTREQVQRQEMFASMEAALVEGLAASLRQRMDFKSLQVQPGKSVLFHRLPTLPH